MSSYQYLPLPPGGGYTRLLRLLPNASEAKPLQCELFDYNLQDPSGRTHLYNALSYVWGDPEDTRPIYIGKYELHVTTNLHIALLHLRNFSLERIIWVDAICINQKNDKEREQQVRLMAKIYSQAICVLIWLGEKTEETDGALEDIRLAANKELLGHSEKDFNKRAILNLLQRPWFRRIWVRKKYSAIVTILTY